MSNGDDAVLRKSHVKRIYKDDDPESDQWIDIERIDELRFESKKQLPWREKRWTFDWDSFDPDGVDVDGKEIPKKKIKEHPDDSDNDAIAVPVRAVVMVTQGKEQQYQAYKHYFINDDSNSTRETHSRHVFHYDITNNMLDDNKQPPRNPDDYLNALGDKDKDQFVEVEILDKYWTNEHESRNDHGDRKAGNWQEKKWLIDSDVDQLLKDRDGDTSKDGATINPSGGEFGDIADAVTIDPPWRLDPLQNIVNVQWGGLAVIFGPESEDAAKQDKTK